MGGCNERRDVSFRLMLQPDCAGWSGWSRCTARCTTAGTGRILRTMYVFAFVVAVSVFRFVFDFNSSDLGGDCKRKDTASGSENELHFSCVDDDRVSGIPVVNGSITRIAIATVVIVITIRSKNMKDGLPV